MGIRKTKGYLCEDRDSHASAYRGMSNVADGHQKLGIRQGTDLFPECPEETSH